MDSSNNNGIEIIFGTTRVSWVDPNALLELLKKNGISHLDTAYIYEKSEETLGKANVGDKNFIIDTKAPGFYSKSNTRESIHKGMKESLERLKVDKVETYFLHSPDPDTPISETIEAINELYKEGKFKNFGLSNFLAEEVVEICEYAKTHNCVLPSIYQGSYNPISTANEELINMLHERGIKFYAYSPIAGGFLTKSADLFKETQQVSRRWDPNSSTGKLYHALYNKPELLEALNDWENIAKDANTSKAALAYRWVKYNSALKAGDAVIFSSSKMEQVEETISWLNEGPLSQDIVDRILEFSKKVSKVAPRDNFNSSKSLREKK